MEFQFDSLSEFIWMKGHGPYVWAAYLITLFTFLGLLMTVVIARKNFFKTQRSIAEREIADAASKSESTSLPS